MATLLGTLPSCCKSEMERHGDGPKPGLNALAEPRKIRNAPKAPASASSANLQATGRDAGSFPSPEVSAAASSLPKDSPRGLIRAVELEKRAFFPRAVVPTACRAQPETPAPATPRHATPPGTTHRPCWKEPRPRVPSPSLQAGCRRSGQWLQMDLQPEPLRTSSAHLLRLTQFCALLLSLTFLHRLPGTSMATQRARVPGFSAPGAKPKELRPAGAGREGGASSRQGWHALSYARARARGSDCAPRRPRLRNGSGAEVWGVERPEAGVGGGLQGAHRRERARRSSPLMLRRGGA